MSHHPTDPIRIAREVAARLRREAKGYREIMEAGTTPDAPWAWLVAQLDEEAAAIEQLIEIAEGKGR